MHSIESRSQRCTDTYGKEVLVAQVVMQCVTKQEKNHQEQVISPRKQVSECFLKRRRTCKALRTGNKGAETLKVGVFFAFYFRVFHPSDLMGCGRYMGEFSHLIHL